jgi:hypothetical protein
LLTNFSNVVKLQKIILWFWISFFIVLVCLTDKFCHYQYQFGKWKWHPLGFCAVSNVCKTLCRKCYCYRRSPIVILWSSVTVVRFSPSLFSDSLYKEPVDDKDHISSLTTLHFFGWLISSKV